MGKYESQLNDISIIVPVYNASSYLNDAISSVTKQTYKGWKLILVDDGSTDGSSDICDSAKASDDRITVIHQENAGVSAARNRGIAIVDTEYTVFMDADDMMPPNALMDRINTINDNDLLITSYHCISEIGGGEEHYDLDDSENYETNIRSDAKDFIEDLPTGVRFGYQGFLWNKLFRTDIIKANNILFNEDISYNEDRLFVYQYLRHCDHVIITDDYTYDYIQHDDSKMGQVRSKAFNTDMLTELDAFQIMKDQMTMDGDPARFDCSYSMYYAARNLSDHDDISPEIRSHLKHIEKQNFQEFMSQAKGRKYSHKKFHLLKSKYGHWIKHII